MISQIGMYVGGIVAVVNLLWILRVYNSMHTSEQIAKEQLANILTALLRRYDLVPQVLEVTKEVAQHEQLHVQITELRNLLKDDKGSVLHIQTKITHVENTIQAVLVAVRENYPEIYSSSNFEKLVDILVETEDKIAGSRSLYNRAVALNVQQFMKIPNKFYARAFGFMPYEFITFDTVNMQTLNISKQLEK